MNAADPLKSLPPLDALDKPGFTPGKEMLPQLLAAYLKGLEGKAEGAVRRALLRRKDWLLPELAAWKGDDQVEVRSYWQLLGRAVGKEGTTLDFAPAVARALGGQDPKVARQASLFAAKRELGGLLANLGAALEKGPAPALKLALWQAIGVQTEPGALQLLQAQQAANEAESQALQDAINRHSGGAEAPIGHIDRARVPEQELRYWLQCRRGVEGLLQQEISRSELPRHQLERGTGCVFLQGRLPLEDLLGLRTWMGLGFDLGSLPSDPKRWPQAIGERLSQAMASAAYTSLQSGPGAFRFGVRGQKLSRRALKLCAQQAEAALPWRNDTSARTWDLWVDVETHRGEPGEVRGGQARLVLCPRFKDERFQYRVADVPGASHPTLAAALVQAGGVQTDDVVWDPFAGGGNELIERALAAPYSALYGSDWNKHAVAKAAQNLEAAGIADGLLAQADARRWTPPKAPTLILSNLPMGRRIAKPKQLEGLLDAFVRHAASQLARRGRLVMLSPVPRTTRRAAEQSGLVQQMQQRVDMRGYWAELQRFDTRLGFGWHGAAWLVRR